MSKLILTDMEHELLDGAALAREYIEKLQTDNAELNARLTEAYKTYMAGFAKIEAENRRLKKLVKELIPPCVD